MRKDDLIEKFSPFLTPHPEGLRTLSVQAAWLLTQRFVKADALLYDNYNFVVCGWTYTGKPGDAFMSLAVASNHASLCFLQGAQLHDPEKRLKGGGRIVRNLRLDSLDLLEDPYVSNLIDSAAAAAKRGGSSGLCIVRSISPVKRRPKRSP